MPGILMSSRIKSGCGFLWAMSSAFSPLVAAIIVLFAFKIFIKRCKFSRTSSTIRIRGRCGFIRFMCKFLIVAFRVLTAFTAYYAAAYVLVQSNDDVKQPLAPLLVLSQRHPHWR